MFAKLKEEYGRFRASPPGRRFQERHQRRRENRRNSRMSHVLKIGGGGIILLAGLFFMPAPGPGSLVAVLGLALLADEFRFLARLLDTSEVRLRHVLGWAARVFRRLPLPVKTAVILLGLVAAVGTGYGAWWMWFGS
jgi:uncharacterized protein (TIGR02611 family)